MGSDTNEDTSLYQNNGKNIDLDEHVYYQGCGYAIGFHNPNIIQQMFFNLQHLCQELIMVTCDSFSNIDSFPVNFLNISLYSIGTDLRMNVIRKDSKYKLMFSKFDLLRLNGL